MRFPASLSTSSYKANSFCMPFSSERLFANFLRITALGSESVYTACPMPYIRPAWSNACLSSILRRYSHISSLFSQSLQCSIISANIRCTFKLAPPCLGPLSDAIEAAIAEYVSVPEDVTTCVVNVELLPPPCSA